MARIKSATLAELEARIAALEAKLKPTEAKGMIAEVTKPLDSVKRDGQGRVAFDPEASAKFRAEEKAKQEAKRAEEQARWKHNLSPGNENGFRGPDGREFDSNGELWARRVGDQERFDRARANLAEQHHAWLKANGAIDNDE